MIKGGGFFYKGAQKLELEGSAEESSGDPSQRAGCLKRTTHPATIAGVDPMP